MTDEEERRAILAAIKRHTRENTRSREAARAYLIRAGFFTTTGALRAEYGGPPAPTKAALLPVEEEKGD